MRKRLLALVTILALACSLAPGVAFADDEDGTPIAVTIAISEDGAPAGTSGDGWTYENGELALEEGYAFTITGHAFGASDEGDTNGRVVNKGVIVDGTFNGSVQNWGTIRNGTFNSYVHNLSNNGSAGSIAGGTFNEDVNNAALCIISGGSFDSANNEGTIRGGTFSGIVNTRGTIEGDGVFEGYVQNGHARFDADENKSCTIAGGTFNSDIDNFGTILGGTFKRSVENYGVIAGGSFFLVTNEEDAAILGGEFLGDVVNGGVIKGGFFARGILGEGGTVSACAFPLHTSLSGLSLAEAADREPRVTYDAESDESNRCTLAADEGYTLPASVNVRVGAADGPELVAGTDYTYDAATGAIAIKKRAATGPLRLSASGTSAVKPTPDPQPLGPPVLPTAPSTPEPPSTPIRKTNDAAALAATGDSALSKIAFAAAIFASAALSTCTMAHRRQKG